MLNIPITLDRTERHPNSSESFELALLWGLQSKPVWAGGCDPVALQRRRARNRVARRTRVAQRRAQR